MGYHGSSFQISEYFVAVNAQQDEQLAVMVAVQRAAEALDAQVGAVVVDGAVRGCVGLDTDPVPAGLPDLGLGQGYLKVDGLGTLYAVVADLGQDAGRLIVARADEAFGPDEHQTLISMAQGLGLALQRLHARTDEPPPRTDGRPPRTEHDEREEREEGADDRLKLLDALRIRQRLLETLLSIQRSISQRKPLQEVLDAVTSGAASLLHNSVVTLVVTDPADGNKLTTASTCGPTDRMNDVTLVLAAAAEAMEANCVVTRTGQRAQAHYSSVIAAPVHVNGAIGGSLAADTPADFGHIVEQRELLSAFAQQCSVALTDARIVEAIHEAYHDSLTGLPNRALFLDRLKQAILTSNRRVSDVTVLIIDLDHFKKINDTLGHRAGDELLLAVANRIQGRVRSGDMAARLGGDEFGVLLEGATAQAGLRVARTVVEALKEPFRIGRRDVRIVASAGVASSHTMSADAGDLLTAADVAIYRAKKARTGRIVAYEPHMHTEIVERLNLEGDLQGALRQDQFCLQYQPMVRLATGEPIGVEALLRWTHPERGSVPPSVFIPIAEDTDLIVDIGRWVLRESCRQVGEWRNAMPGMTLSLNVSARQIMDSALVREIGEALTAANLPADALTLDLTETALMNDSDKALQQLRRLKDLGVRIAIDDFGTGYSSLSYLRQFPVDQLKIDRDFVADINGDADNLAVVGTVIELGRVLRLETVAEGIEDAEQLEALRRLGCDLGQGYHLARPLSRDAVASHFRRQRDLPSAA